MRLSKKGSRHFANFLPFCDMNHFLWFHSFINMSPVDQSVEHSPSDQLPEVGVGSSPSRGTNLLQKDFFRFHQKTKNLQNGRYHFPVTSFFTDFNIRSFIDSTCCLTSQEYFELDEIFYHTATTITTCGAIKVDWKIDFLLIFCKKALLFCQLTLSSELVQESKISMVKSKRN